MNELIIDRKGNKPRRQNEKGRHEKTVQYTNCRQGNCQFIRKELRVHKFSQELQSKEKTLLLQFFCTL